MPKRKHEHQSAFSTAGLPPSLNDLINPNFEELARCFPEFGSAWKEVKTKQYQDGGSSLSSCMTQSFSIGLTKALLHVHFRVSLAQVPIDHLCPPVPNRYYLIHWIHNYLLPRLIDSFLPQSRKAKVFLDIGTGPTCIYPLLMASTYSSPSSPCKFYATDVDAVSVQQAIANVTGNPTLSPFISVRQVSPSSTQIQSQITKSSIESNEYHGPLLRSVESVDIQDRSQIDVCLTNPPFFDEGENHRGPRAGDGRQRTAMSVSEGCYPGGEVGFISDMIMDSLLMFLAQRTTAHLCPSPPRWCVCMCGKKSSFLTLNSILEQLLGVSHTRFSEFGPGYTTRWFVAWSLERPVARSPLAVSDKWNFQVKLDSDPYEADSDGPCDQVVTRIAAFCNEIQTTLETTVVPTSKLWSKNVLIKETTRATSWHGDNNLPTEFQAFLTTSGLDMQRNELLPTEGHLLIELSVDVVDTMVATVNALSFAHTRYGKMRVEQIKSQIVGEVCRTNRKWRRKLKRELAEPMVES